ASLMIFILPHLAANWFTPALAVYGFFFMASYPLVEDGLMEAVQDAVRGRVFGLFITAAGLIGSLESWFARQRVTDLGPRDGPAATGFSEQTLAVGLDSFFKHLTAENLEKLLVQEIGHVRRLDDFFHDQRDEEKKCAGMALGPEFLFHFAAGNIPNPIFMSIL